MPKAIAIAAAAGIAAASALAFYIIHRRRRAVTAAATPAAINFATEWLDELGRVCRKAVDYATQCPKGHDLVALAGGGGAPAQRLLCRVCHAFTEREHASQWLVCSVTGCCAGYAVCDCCVGALQQTPAPAPAGDGAPSAVSATARARA